MINIPGTVNKKIKDESGLLYHLAGRISFPPSSELMSSESLNVKMPESWRLCRLFCYSDHEQPRWPVALDIQQD